jgi:hypothetical protein
MRRRKNFAALTLLVLLAAGVLPSLWSREQPPHIEELLKGDDAIVIGGSAGAASPVVTLGRRFGGSVVSVFHRGVEYVNNDSANQVDYGRQLQSAVQYRGVGECFNPTEAGGKYDRGRPMSSSRLLSVERPAPNVVVTSADMAFWMYPGQERTKKGKECFALNKDFRGGYILKRTIKVGMDGFPNVIYYRTQFTAPIVEPTPRYVPVVLHSPLLFSRIFRVGKEGTAVEILGERNQRGNQPFMLTTDDQAHAALVCSATPPADSFYGYTRHGNTTTSRFVYFAKGPEKESRVFDNYVIVGTASEVQKAVPRFCFAG